MKLSIFGEKATLFSGKKALVTGGSTGIGRATALQLARWGADVMIFGRHEREIEDATTQLRLLQTRVFGLCADQAVVADVKRVFERVDADLGGIDYLINNAAEDVGSLDEIDDARIDYSVRQNLTGYLTCTRQALERMRPGAHIVNIGSMSAQKRGAEGEVYTAAKSGIRGFSESLRKTVKKRQIRVSLIEPGWVGTDMSKEDPQEQRELQERNEMLKAEDIAVAVAFCLAQPLRCDVAMMQFVALLDD